MIVSQALDETLAICPGARLLDECGLTYVLLPGLRLPVGCTPPECDGLLCLQPRDGYPTRLFLSLAGPIPGKGNNWNVFRILDRAWYSWSWNHVPYTGRPAETLAQHLVALR